MFNDTVKNGKVVKTTPEVGTYQPKGTTIYVTISKGPEIKITTVPSLINLTKDKAKEILENNGLSIGKITESYSETVSEGNVISQSVNANTSLEEGSFVNVVISKGSEMVTIPDLWGNPQDRVIEKLKELELECEFYEEYSDEAINRVYRTVPAANEKIKRGSIVKVYISKGPNPVQMVDIPDLIGKTIDEAKASLEAVGLKMGNVTYEYDDAFVKGYIMKQSTTGKTESGSFVDIVVSNGQNQIVNGVNE